MNVPTMPGVPHDLANAVIAALHDGADALATAGYDAAGQRAHPLTLAVVAFARVFGWPVVETEVCADLPVRPDETDVAFAVAHLRAVGVLPPAGWPATVVN